MKSNDKTEMKDKVQKKKKFTYRHWKREEEDQLVVLIEKYGRKFDKIS